MASLFLVVSCWNRRAVLAGLCSTAATTLAITAIASEQTPRHARITFILASVTLGIAAALLVLGEAIWRALSDPPNEDR